jgi:peptidoglycan/xylan/chitin deacetylase (PgdA/CDA1 family)
MRTQILGYHEIVEGPSSSFYSLSTEQFRKQLRLFSELDTNYTFSIEITFDDGHASNWQIAAPLLQENSRIATFFVTAGWIGKRDGFMQWSQLSNLILQGHKIQSHGLTHRFLTQLNGAELATELRDSKTMLEDHLQQEMSEISLPGGRYNERVLEMCAEAGYRRIYSSVPWNETAQTPCVELRGRLIVNNRMSQDWLRRYLRGDTAPYLLLRFVHTVREMAKATLGDNFYHNVWSTFSRRHGIKANAR